MSKSSLKLVKLLRRWARLVLQKNNKRVLLIALLLLLLFVGLTLIWVWLRYPEECQAVLNHIEAGLLKGVERLFNRFGLFKGNTVWPWSSKGPSEGSSAGGASGSGSPSSTLWSKGDNASGSVPRGVVKQGWKGIDQCDQALKQRLSQIREEPKSPRTDKQRTEDSWEAHGKCKDINKQWVDSAHVFADQEARPKKTGTSISGSYDFSAKKVEFVYKKEEEK